MISVIIPCFNSEEYVGRAIESVLNQTYKDYEIILVDNNSTDNTYCVLQNYKKKYHDLVQVFKEDKSGAPAARNKGLQEAKGEWLQFLDSDDELLPYKLKDQMEIAQNTKADIIVGESYMCKVVDDKTEVTTRQVVTDNIWEGLLTSRLGSTTSNLWRRHAIISVGGWNEAKTSSQEYELMFRMLQKNDKVDFSSVVQSIVHVRPTSLHKSNDKKRLVQILDNNVNLRLQIKQYLKSHDKLTKELANIADKYIYAYLVNTTGVHPMSLEQGLVPTHVKRKLRESELNLPVSFLLKYHWRRIIYKVKKKILD